MSAPKPCRKCLLADMDDEAAKKIIGDGIEAILDADRTEEEVYHERLSICRLCDNLLSGTCLQCGCYVEIRAAIKKGRCPEKKW